MPAETLDSLPRFANPETVFARASIVLMPRKRMQVAAAAEQYRFITSGGQVGMWRNSTAPYMVEPMNLTTSRDHEAVAFVGPARSAKTAGLILNPLLHRIVCDPANGLIVHTDQMSARLFSMQDLSLLNEHCPEVRSRLSGNRNENNIFDKRYRGMLLVVGWPTINHLSAKDYEFVYITDYDRMPDDVNGEGSVFALARKRNQTFGSRGITVVESSPGRVVTIDPERPWSPSGHEAPPTTGILDVYNQGDRRWWYWPCPDCGEFFSAKYSDLTWPKNDNGSPLGGTEAAAAKVTMTCPHCSSWGIEERQKHGMNARGVWLREGQSIDKAGHVVGEGKQSAIASFWLKGPAAAFQSWSSIVRNTLDAEEKFRRTGDVLQLKTITNVDHGEPFWPQADPGTEILDPKAIQLRAEPWKPGTVPAGVRAIVVTVDVQGRYFDVQVTGFGEEFECWVIDRQQISQSAEENRLVDPGSYSEDWDLLWPLIEQGYPLVEDPTRQLHPLCMMIDSGGAPGVTGNAYRFAAAARSRRISDDRLMLLKGDAKVGSKRVALSKIDWQSSGKPVARGLRMLLVSSNELKDDVAGALRRQTPGPNYVHVPGEINAEWFDQVTAEEKGPKGWARRSTSARNEAFDHMCYARAAVLRPPWRWDRINWVASPPWAAPLESNSLVTKIAADGGDTPASPAIAPAPAAGRRAGWLNKRGH